MNGSPMRPGGLLLWLDATYMSVGRWYYVDYVVGVGYYVTCVRSRLAVIIREVCVLDVLILICWSVLCAVYSYCCEFVCICYVYFSIIGVVWDFIHCGSV